MKILFLTLTLLLSMSSFAHESCGEPEFSELSDLINLQRKITWESATQNEIKNANCLRKNPFSVSEMSDWLRSHETKARLNKNINGINFENETPENLEAFYHLTTYVDILGNADPKKNKMRTSTCKKVDCALKEIFGPEIGVQLHFMQARFGLNGSHIVREDSAPWKKEELDTVLLAISDFPEGVMPFEKSRTLVHAPRGMNSDRTLANATIMIFDLWNTQSPEQGRSTIVHELAHAIGGVTQIDQSTEWMEQGGWVSAGKMKDGKLEIKAKTSRPETAVSKYGMTNEREDFAESVVAYRYSPAHLKEKSPEKYYLIKNTIFDGVEYTSTKACAEPYRMSQMAKDNAAAQLMNWSPSSDEIKKIADRCSEEAVTQFANDGELKLGSPTMEDCYKESIKLSANNVIKSNLKDDPHFKFMDPMFRNLDPGLSNEFMAKTLNKTKDNHRHILRNQVSRAISEKYHCKPSFKSYANQDYKKDELGFNPYYKSKEFTKIAEIACPKLINSNANKVVEELIQ
ncbi:hypothetical protein [Peredibacter starrii]|uniref:Uncharacterized protein n=1 Tax=Peredibacter starrii TaxID=28202 RepID=A0AAX4HQI3_9BACT|nr:hypothetical protein [Peredibacter starrii]WPU65486.1 hypothetical protein SOO65_01875 [Peredibacter starrii]